MSYSRAGPRGPLPVAHSCGKSARARLKCRLSLRSRLRAFGGAVGVASTASASSRPVLSCEQSLTRNGSFPPACRIPDRPFVVEMKVKAEEGTPPQARSQESTCRNIWLPSNTPTKRSPGHRKPSSPAGSRRGARVPPRPAGPMRRHVTLILALLLLPASAKAAANTTLVADNPSESSRGSSPAYGPSPA